ncbi:hypothetical protein D3C78_1045730 [compost metagenome]
MIRSKVKTLKFRIGKKKFLLIKIFQSAVAKAKHGNVLASNAATVKIVKKSKHR